MTANSVDERNTNEVSSEIQSDSPAVNSLPSAPRERSISNAHRKSRRKSSRMLSFASWTTNGETEMEESNLNSLITAIKDLLHMTNERVEPSGSIWKLLQTVNLLPDVARELLGSPAHCS